MRWEREGRDGCQREIPKWGGQDLVSAWRWEERKNGVEVDGAFVPQCPGQWSYLRQQREPRGTSGLWEEVISIYVDFGVTTGRRVVQWAVETGPGTQERSELIAWRRELKPPQSV